MRYTKRTPCELCPFKRGGLQLSKERAEELGGQIVDVGGNGGRPDFPCHKTATEIDGEYIATDKSVHCAGALIFAEKQDAPTQMMRIAERLGMYDRRKLDMDADVYDSLDEMIDAAAPGRRRRRA